MAGKAAVVMILLFIRCFRAVHYLLRAIMPFPCFYLIYCFIFASLIVSPCYLS
jgi:hypothetical protein